MADGWVVTDAQYARALQGVRMQAAARDINVDDANVADFIEHTARVIAAALAGQHYYCNIIHERTDAGEYS